jgi:hypothetical protein
MSEYVQYTVRRVPRHIDLSFKAQAKKLGLSMNSFLLNKIGAQPVKATKQKEYHDLDWMIGSMPDDEADKLWADIYAARQESKRMVQAEFDANKRSA